MVEGVWLEVEVGHWVSEGGGLIEGDVRVDLGLTLGGRLGVEDRIKLGLEFSIAEGKNCAEEPDTVETTEFSGFWALCTAARARSFSILAVHQAGTMLGHFYIQD